VGRRNEWTEAVIPKRFREYERVRRDLPVNLSTGRVPRPPRFIASKPVPIVEPLVEKKHVENIRRSSEV